MNILKKIVIIAISFVVVLSLIQQDNYSANGSIAAQNGNEVSSDHSSPENSGLPVDTQEPEITWTPIETAHPSETEVPVESILPEPTELPTETEEPEDLPVIAPTEDSFLVDEGMMVESSSSSMMSADLLTITTNKPVAPNTWEYWEDTEALNVVITIGKDNTLPAGTIREIVFDADEYKSAALSPFIIHEYPKQTSAQIKQVTLGADSRSVIYKIDNDALPSKGIQLSFIFSRTYYTTTYHKAGGTMAYEIGAMLLKNPNKRLALSLLDKTTNSKKIEEIVLKREGLDDTTPLIGEIKASVSKATLENLYIAHSGEVVYGDKSGYIIDNSSTYPGIFAKFTQVENRAPIGNIRVIGSDRLLNGTSSTTVSFNPGKELFTTFSFGDQSSFRYVSGIGIPTIIGSLENKQVAHSLNAIKPYLPYTSVPGLLYSPTKNLVRRFENVNELVPNSRIKLGGLSVVYDQVVSNGDGTYRVENKRQEIAEEIFANVPEYSEVILNRVEVRSNRKNIYKDSKTLYVSGISVGTSTYNRFGTKLSKGKVTITPPKEFDTSALTILRNSIIFDKYYLTYSDGSVSDKLQGNSAGGSVISTPHNSNNLQVSSIVLELSSGISFYYSPSIALDNHLESNVGVFQLEGSMTSALPTTGSIRGNVLFENEENSARSSDALSWNIYQPPPVDENYSVQVNQMRYEPILDGNHEGKIIIAAGWAGGGSGTYKYLNIRHEVNIEAPYNELLTGKINFASSLCGLISVEYTTNLSPISQQISKNEGCGGSLTIPLSTDDVIKNIIVTAEEFRYQSSMGWNTVFDLRTLGKVSLRDKLKVGVDYLVNVKVTAGDEFGQGGFTNPNDPKHNFEGKLQIMEAVASFYHGWSNNRTGGLTVPSSVERNTVLKSISFEIPNADKWRYYNEAAMIYPKGSKLYYKINEPYFKYVGNDPRGSTETINGESWFIFDMAGMNIYSDSSGGQRWPVKILNNAFMATIHTEDLQKYQLFEEGYFDLGPFLSMNPDEIPYVRTEFLSNNPAFSLIEDIGGITKGSNVLYEEKRLLPITVPDHTIQIVSSGVDSLNIFPGKTVAGQDSYSHGGIKYIASEYDQLKLQLTIASAEKSYMNYQLAIELPTKGMSYTDQTGATITSASDIRLSNLSNSVFLSDEYKGGNIQYCKSLNFDESTGTEIVANCDTASTVTDAKHVLISIPEVKIGSLGVIELKLSAIEEDIYEQANNTTSYVAADARFYEQYPGEAVSKNVGKVVSKNYGGYTFNWYLLEGKVFSDFADTIPDGMFSNMNGDLNQISRTDKRGRLMDLNDESKYPFEKAVDGKYKVYIQPKRMNGSSERYLHNLTLDLKEGNQYSEIYLWNRYRITLNTSDHPNIEANNNFPRQDNEQTEGIQFYADIHGIEAVKYVTQKEIEEGFVNIGLYVNPQTILNPSVIIVKPKESLTFEAKIRGIGKYSTSPLELNDGELYGKLVTDRSTDSLVSCTLVGGIEEALTPTLTSLYPRMTANMINYFDEPVDQSFIYQVLKAPYIQFMLKAKDSDLTGTWPDGEVEDSKEIKISKIKGGSISLADIPKILPPEGYSFVGWSKYSTFLNIFQYSHNKYEKVYPLFEEDKKGALDSSFQPVGDEIPDKFQTEFIISVDQGGILTKGEVTTEDTKSPMSVFVTRLRSQSVNALYPVAELNPQNWIEKNGKTGVTLKAVDLPMASPINADHYEFVDWTIEDKAYSDASEIEAKGAVFVEESYAIKANFYKKVATVTFLKNEVGQKSQKTEEVHILKGSSLTEDDLSDTLGITRKTPKYGWVFTNYLNTLTDEVIDGDEEAKHLVLNEDLSIQPQFEVANYAVQFKISEPVMGEEYLDEYGNTLEEVLDDQTVPFNHKGELLEVPIVKPSENEKWKDLFKFSSWRYEMNCDPDLTECIAGKTEGFIEDPKDLVITGDVTFHAEMIGKPFVAVTQNVGGKTVLEKMIEEDEMIDFNLESLDKYNFTEEEKTVNFSKEETELRPGQYDVGFAAKADNNHRIHKITAQVYKNQPINSEIESVVLYENGELLKEALTEVFTNSPITGDSITFVVKDEQVLIGMDDIGGTEGLPTGLVLEVEFAKRPNIIVPENPKESTGFKQLPEIADQSTNQTIEAPKIKDPLPKENYTSYFDIKSGSWITLITCLASGILGLLVLLLKRHKQEKQGAGIALYTRNNAFIYTATLVGFIAFTLALLTQDIGANKMLIDKYSFISVILLVVTILFVVLGMMWKKDVTKESTHPN